MSSRYPPPARDRSPPPRYDRRPSTTYTPVGSSYRGAADPAPPSSDRAPPRGPRAETRGGSFGFSPATRGRGAFPSRASDTWDRDRDRDSRDRDRERDVRPAAQSYRARDDDRPDLFRRDRDFGPTDRAAPPARDSRSYVGRDRSASPVRPRRDSRESLPSTFSRATDSASSYYAPAARGGLGRGRGRGDWDRARGRSSFVGERDRELFPRSRSRESWRDRDFERGRPPPSDLDRSDRYDRRDFDRSREREPRREHDIWQRDQSPTRSSAGNAASSTTPATERPPKDLETGKRPPVAATPTSSARDGRRDGDQSDYFTPSRLDPPRRDPAPNSQPSSSAGGLDYGPPPSVAQAAIPPTEKPPAAKPQPVKVESAPSAQVPFQPPSGPKAQRAPSIVTQIPKPQHHDTWPRNEQGARSSTSTQQPSPASASNENAPKKDEPTGERRTSAPPADRSMPANVPSGPRLGVPAYKPRLPSTEPPAAPPPSAPREPPKPLATDSRSPIIPTGPRLDREAARPLPGTASKIWVSPDYKQKPSIMNQLNKPYQQESRDRPSMVPTGPRNQMGFHGPGDRSRLLQSPPTSVPLAPSGPKALMPGSPRGQDAKLTLLPRPHIEEIQQSEDVDMSLPASSEDDDEAEDDAFDEEYLAESEEKFRQEMDLLEARKPPQILHDEGIVTLIMRIQFLEMLSQDTWSKPATVSLGETAKDSVESVAPLIPPPIEPPVGLPSPYDASKEGAAPSDEEHPFLQAYTKGRPLREAPVNPIPTPPVEDLPYLNDVNEGIRIFEDSDDEVEHEAVSTALQQEFERAAWDYRDKIEDCHADFTKRFPMWKQEVAQLEQERRELQGSPAPASPAPSIAPSVTPSLTHERTRGARNTTEADLEKAILMSQQSAREEEERREREAASSSAPNYESEAKVPYMLKPADVDLTQFEDTNMLIPTDIAIEIFGFLPPEDDFTEEEQTLFITAYCQTPKKWGKIAEAIPGRTYKDCIAHYYLTKNHVRYKDILRRSQPKKRRGRAATKPRSTALMSELDYRDGEEHTPGPVTDSGRPRRAAAPTFGDTTFAETDAATLATQSKKPTTAPKDGNADPTTQKSGRGRKTGIATKTRRTKAQIQADQQAQAMLLASAEGSPVKPPTTAKAERARTLLRAENLPSKVETTPALPVPRPIEQTLQQFPVELPPVVPVVPVAPVAPNHATTSQVTSYWSVPEQSKFPELLSYYGRDFAAIAEFMKTKSATMIKNHYLREINAGKTELEKLAQLGEQNKSSGKQLPNPPSPIAPAKRRYEATPSMATIPRHPMAQVEQPVVEQDPPPMSLKPSQVDEFPRNIVERNAAGELVAKTRQPIREREMPAASLPLAQPKVEEGSRMERAPLYQPKPLQGPKSGVFQEEPRGYVPRSTLRMSLDERSPLQLPQRLADIPHTEIGQLQAPTLPPSNIGQARETAPPQQRQTVVPVAVSQGPQIQAEKYAPQHPFQSPHSRNGSLVAPSHVPIEQAQDLLSLRRFGDQPRSSFYGTPAVSSPAPAPPISQSQRPEVAAPPTVLPLQPPPRTVETPKPSAKRSTIASLLNDDPPEQPPSKRPSLEAPQRQPLVSPQPAPVSVHGNPIPQPRGQLHGEDRMREAYGHGGLLPGQQTASDFARGYAASPTAAQGNEADAWMRRYDPRQQAASAEQRNLHNSPAPSPYSLVPPSSQPPAIQSLRIDDRRPLDSRLDHRRTILGQMSTIPHAPSPPPPPQPQSEPIPPYRSASSASHHAHSRVSSVAYGQSQPVSQGSPLDPRHAQQAHSATSTPVSSLHQRGQSSIDYQPRLTIQQHMAQQSQQKAEQQREHERAVQHQHQHQHQHQQHQQQQQHQHQHQHQREREMRELEAANQARRAEREREAQAQAQQQHQQHMRRDMYGHGLDTHARGQPTPLGTPAPVPVQNHLSYGSQRDLRDIPPRYATPPSHGVQYNGPGPSIGGGHGPAMPHSHQPAGPPGQSQGGQQPQQPQQQPQAGAPPHQMHHHHTQSLGMPPGGHYRGLSQGGERERR